MTLETRAIKDFEPAAAKTFPHGTMYRPTPDREAFNHKTLRLQIQPARYPQMRPQHHVQPLTNPPGHAQFFFFPSSMADVALWLGLYMSISSKTSICTRTKTVWKCRQITTNQTTHKPARRPANPPARLAFRQEKQQTRQTKGAGAQTKTPTKKICQRTQWFDHCIILKNMRK